MKPLLFLCLLLASCDLKVPEQTTTTEPTEAGPEARAEEVTSSELSTESANEEDQSANDLYTNRPEHLKDLTREEFDALLGDQVTDTGLGKNFNNSAFLVATFEFDKNIDPESIEVKSGDKELTIEKTGEEGVHKIVDLPEGDHNLVFTAQTLDGKAVAFERPVKAASKDVELGLLDFVGIGHVSGVARIEGYDKHGGIEVSIDGSVWSTKTREDGSFDIKPFVEHGERVLVFRHFGLRTVNLKVTVLEGEITHVPEVTMEGVGRQAANIFVNGGSFWAKQLSNEIHVELGHQSQFMRATAVSVQGDTSPIAWEIDQKTFRQTLPLGQFSYDTSMTQDTIRFNLEFQGVDGSIHLQESFTTFQRPTFTINPKIVGSRYSRSVELNIESDASDFGTEKDKLEVMFSVDDGEDKQ